MPGTAKSSHRRHLLSGVTPIFAAQHGVVARRQALALGITVNAIDHLVRSGRWEAAHPCVYRLAGSAESLEQGLMAAVLAGGPGAAVGLRSAATLHGTRVFQAELVEIVTPPTRRARLDGVLVHRLGDLDPNHLMRVRGIPVTSAARTVADIGMVVPKAFVETLIEEWLADRKLTVAALRSITDELGSSHRRGPALARQVLASRSLGVEAGDSTDEHLIATVLAVYGAPPPVPHHLVHLSTGEIVEVDAAYVEERLAVELHGFTVKTRSRRTYERGLERINDLQADGWFVLQYTPHQIRARPWATARQIDDRRRSRRVDRGLVA
jgi:hypothetical protein